MGSSSLPGRLSTTLHAALKHLVRPDLNVVTVEDPVEYRVDGASPVAVAPAAPRVGTPATRDVWQSANCACSMRS